MKFSISGAWACNDAKMLQRRNHASGNNRMQYASCIFFELLNGLASMHLSLEMRKCCVKMSGLVTRRKSQNMHPQTDTDTISRRHTPTQTSARTHAGRHTHTSARINANSPMKTQPKICLFLEDIPDTARACVTARRLCDTEAAWQTSARDQIDFLSVK